MSLKYLYLLIFIFTSGSFAEEVCESTTDEAISTITNLRIPNCQQSALVNRELGISSLVELRKRNGQPIPSLPRPICTGCKNDFRSRLPTTPNNSENKKNAFFQTSYNELEKSLSSLVIDIASHRNSWSTGSSFSRSIETCQTKRIETELAKCNSSFLKQFKEKNLSNKIGNEVASLISINHTGLEGILDRSGSPKSLSSCPITDVASSNLRQFLFEETISPDLVRMINSVQASSSSELQTRLSKVIGDDNFRLISAHPILKSLLQEPALFQSTFRSLSSQKDPALIKAAFRAKIHSPETGNMIDRKHAEKCSATIESFTKALCNPEFSKGNISLVPYNNFNKFINGDDLDQSDASITEKQINDNNLMFEFCDSIPIRNQVSLATTLQNMNSWMPEEEKDTSLARYSAEKYNNNFGDLKTALCGMLPAPNCNQDNDECRLYNIYQSMKNSPEGRIANSSDPNVNRVLQALIGNPETIAPKARDILIAEGILPQTNGQFVERSTPPERQPDYLANVANGTITPKTETQIAASTAASTNRKQPNRPQGQAQINAPAPSTAAAQTETQLAANTADDADLRRFQGELDERLKRIEGEQVPGINNQQKPQQPRRVVSQAVNSDRTINSQISAGFIPTSAPVQGDVVNPNQAAPISSGEKANLAPDTSRQTLAQRQANEARAQMHGARSNPAANAEAGRTPASLEGIPSSDSTVALTINGDITANLEQVLKSSEGKGSDLRSLIEARRPFLFQLNDSVFDVQVKNGVYVVAYRSGDSSKRALTSTLQSLFNNSIRNTAVVPARSTTLEALKNTVRN
jgi:hypothetical protein